MEGFPAPLAIVSPRFCVPHALRLTLTVTPTGGCTVTDAGGAMLLQMDPLFLRFRVHCRLLLDPAGRSVLTVKRKLLSILDRWDAFRGDSSNRCDLLFTAKKALVIQPGTHLDIFIASNTSQLVRDFRMMGSWNDRSWVLRRSNSSTVVAKMRRQYTVSGALLGTRTFDLTVSPNVDYAFIAALVLVWD
ncbi:hypothetical protein QOZ80_7BG0594010 [Eleusine coracana subsp. coracana]|nr:hypothetical protein QOZ80_7BG0594010 [Eleusine coracana subsp. coracana]